MQAAAGVTTNNFVDVSSMNGQSGNSQGVTTCPNAAMFQCLCRCAMEDDIDFSNQGLLLSTAEQSRSVECVAAVLRNVLRDFFSVLM